MFVQSKPESSELGDGRPILGLAIFYCKSLSLKDVLKHENFHAVKLEHGADTLYSYQFVLGELQNRLDDIPANRILLMGDFTADPIKEIRFWTSLQRFMETYILVMKDLLLPAETFTYLNRAHDTTSCIDHIVTSKSADVNSVNMRLDMATFDHFPIAMNFPVMYQSLASTERI